MSKREMKKRKIDSNDSVVKDMQTASGCLDSVLHIFDTLCSRFKSNQNTLKAVEMSKYMRNQFKFFGIQTPERRALYRDLWTEVKKMNSTDKRRLATLTWQSTEREFQLFSIELLEKEILHIYDDDDGIKNGESSMKTADFVKSFLLDDKSWWDTVDTLAVKVMGPLVKQCPDKFLPVMDKWNTDDNIWLCRTSIIYQNGYKSSTDSERLFRYCLTAAHSKEFFIQKAIGWSLREYYKVDPVNVRNFVQKNNRTLKSCSAFLHMVKSEMAMEKSEYIGNCHIKTRTCSLIHQFMHCPTKDNICILGASYKTNKQDGILGANSF
ncbi:hypothetical protein Btru_065652 [Bulinus truncatus]|nr:hypothetical protein Btru_065652 [Bulinus truncatus]